MSTPLQVRVIPTFSDYLRFNAYVTARRLGWHSLLFPCSWLLALVWVCLHGEFNPGPALVFFVLIGSIFILVPVSVYFTARRRWQRVGEIREPRTYSFTDDGLQVAAETFNGSVRWEHIFTAETTGNLFLLGTGQSAYHLLPKEAFPDEETVGRFITLLTEKVPNTVRLR